MHGDATSGLLIDDAGRSLQSALFGTGAGLDFFYDFKPRFASIKTGTATNGEYYSFGISVRNDSQGLLTNFSPGNGQDGGDIVGVRAANAASTFNLDSLIAGDGGVGGRGGNIEEVILNNDTAGGYVIQAGNGGRGPNGGAGGAIVNFQDFASFTSQVVIRSGDGGIASTGVGGNGGTATFGTLNINGGLGITLGSGGDGFSAGGDGASLATALITTPEGALANPAVVVGSVHDPVHDPVTGLATQIGGIIGRTGALDFDHDGFGDMVYTSTTPSQLVVDFGDGFGDFRDITNNTSTDLPGRFNRIYLPCGDRPEALTVGDFNGDGFYDIATGSHADGNFAGIEVFLAKTEDINQDGILSKAEDLDNDGVIDFLGFRSPRYSPLPSLFRGDPDGGTILDSSYLYRRTATPISALTAGDFNGDGITDLGVVATYTTQGPLIQTQVVIFMTPDVENGRPTGQFYADVGTKAVADPPAGANPFVPFYPLDGFPIDSGTDAVIEATALSGIDTHDYIVGSTVNGYTALSLFDNSQPSIAGPLYNLSPNPYVDTDRGPGFVRTLVTVRDVTISDTNLDGLADATVITENPAGYVVATLGNGVFASADPFPTSVIGQGGNNTGAYLPEFDLTVNTTVIRNTSIDLNGDFDEVAIGFSDVRPGVIAFAVSDTPTITNGDGNLTPFFVIGPITAPSALAADIYFPTPDSFPNLVNHVFGAGNRLVDVQDPFIVGAVQVAEHYIRLSAGDGGDALVGRGGAAGSIGNPLAIANATDPVTGIVDPNALGAVFVVLPDNPTFDGFAQFNGGKGGNGFSTGGKGGSVSSVAVRYATLQASPKFLAFFHSEARLFAGDGGFGVAGPGGAGGDLTGNTVQGGGRGFGAVGSFFFAGDGGRGTIGGNGGVIRGNGNGNIFDAEDVLMSLRSGDGGNGTRQGGAGGDILNFAGLYDIFFSGESAGLLQHIAGNGGSAISGPGGQGGSVINSSPILGESTLSGDIILMAGNGGNGLSGGAGGSVVNFTDRPSTTDNPAVLAFLAGSGGRGSTGRGGPGGSVTNIDTPSTGKPNPFSDNFFLDPRIAPMPYTFNRFLAGDGGKSAGSRGGVGGNISTIDTSNSDGPFVMVSGAGGNGLFRGGNGGNLQDIQINLGSESFNKALFIAGAGGSAASWKSNNLDTSTGDQGSKFFGGKIGRPGAGGNIVNLTQSGSIGARLDIIAGNGGDLINYGTVADEKLPVGKGGSILNVSLAGNIGNIQPNIRLTSYNDVIAGQSLQDFVTINLRDPLVPGSFDDSIGMVGLVAGAAGRLKEVPNGFDPSNTINYRSQPATGGVNGSVINITARNIASMVAGSVERIAAIQVVGGINLPGGGILGKDFDDNIDSARYRDPEGAAILEPVLDGSLVDGALVYSKFTAQDLTDKLPPSPRIFQLGNRPNRAHAHV